MPTKDMYKNIHSSLIQDSPIPEPKCIKSGQINSGILPIQFPYNGKLYNNENKQFTIVYNSMNKSHRHEVE